MPNVAVVGAGAWGQHLVRNFHALGSLGMICDKDPGTLRAMADRYPGTPVTTDFQEVLENSDLAGIAIATPAETHFELARRALLWGDKHLFVEKPLALRVEEGIELIRLAGDRRRVLMVGHVLHHHPAVLKLKTMIQGGELGRVHYVHSTRLNTGRIRRGENVLWSLAPHDVSMIILLLGEDPTAVRTSGGNHLRQGIPDVSATVMDFESGARGHVFTSWLYPFKEQKLVVVGEEAMAVFDDVNGDKLRIYEHKVRWDAGAPVATKGPSRSVSVEEAEPLASECRHFLESFANGRTPLTDGREALKVLTILDACQRSLERGGERVLINRQVAQTPPAPDSGIHPTAFVHETAVVDAGARVGARTRIWHFSHILGDTWIGSGCTLGQNVMVGPRVRVGDRCKIQNNVSVYQGVTLEDEVFCGPSAVFTNVRNPRAAVPRMDELQPTLVRRGASIGANATVVCGVEVGRYAFIGAGAVVTRSVPDYALVLGNPAARVGWMCACGLRLPEDLTCASCGEVYRENDEVLTPRPSGGA